MSSKIFPTQSPFAAEIQTSVLESLLKDEDVKNIQHESSTTTILFSIAASIALVSVVFLLVRKYRSGLVRIVGELPEKTVSPLEERKRRQMIENNIIQKKVVYDVTKEPEIEQVSADEEEGVPKSPNDDLPIVQSNSTKVAKLDLAKECEYITEPGKSCPICTEEFTEGELVAMSKNIDCSHIYHTDCIIPWLLKSHDECPMCRNEFLVEEV